MKQRLTPHYDHAKVANPTCADQVDIFEDAWKRYTLGQIQGLLRNPHGDIAAMILLCSYFESIEALHRGESSVRRSKEFFAQGFLRVFQKHSDPNVAIAAAEAIYRHVRCGVAHTGFPTLRVHIQRTNPNAFILTYPLLPDGQPDPKSSVQSVLVNAQRMYDAMNWHLVQFVDTLRLHDDVILQMNFDHPMRSSCGIGEYDNVVGMTETEFTCSIWVVHTKEGAGQRSVQLSLQ